MRTLLQSASSSSATSNASVVIEPCPSSEMPDWITIAPSGWMRTHAFGRSGAEVPLVEAANDGRTNANPRAPVEPRNCRRDIAILVVIGMSSRRLGRLRHGAHDALVGAAAA